MKLRTASNPPNPWSDNETEWVGEPPDAKLEIFEETAKSMLSRNDSPDLTFRWSTNPYRGCLHACAYCYARPSHQYLGFGAGTDFDTKLVVKLNAAVVLEREIARPSWKGESIVFSGNTDCYQPIEAGYRLTRQCLEVCLRYNNPVVVITKGALVRRDVEVLSKINQDARAVVHISVAFADDTMARKIEPYASAPSVRFETIRRLAEAGIPTGVSVSPVIVGLNDSDVPSILRRAREAGAESAFLTPLRLPKEVLPVWEERLARVCPDRANKVKNATLEVRGGKMNEASFGQRMQGRGPRWDAIRQLFELHCRKLGLRNTEGPDTPPKRHGIQQRLFEE